MANEYKYSIVVPTLNERENIVPLLQKIESCGLAGFEILVVDENSPDGTCDAVNQYAEDKPYIRCVLNDGVPGLSPSIVKGFTLAEGEYLACMDGDLQHDVRNLTELLNKLDDFDFVIGSRFIPGGGFAEKWSPARLFISKTAALLARIILGVKVKDPMSGFFAVRHSAFDKIKDKMSPKGFKIMLEMLFLLSHAEDDFKITESAITFGLRQHGKSKLSGKVIFQYLAMLLELRRSVRRTAK